MLSSGSGAEIDVSIAPETHFQHVRLLELPPELLDLLTSEHPPTLHFKSAEIPNGNKDSSAVLCTADKTYNVRQVSTSNSVFIARSSGSTDQDGGEHRTGIEAFAKCDSTLELTAAAKQSAAPFIKAALPVFSSTGNYGSQTIDKAHLFSHIPLSHAECEQGWSELACFESQTPKGCFIPSAQVRMQIWETAMTAAVAEGYNLKDVCLIDGIPVFATELKTEWPCELITSIFQATSVPIPGGNIALDEEKCVRFVGLGQLEARSGGSATDATAFLEAWRDALPESWRERCELSLLKGSYQLRESSSSIIFVDDASSSTGESDKPNEGGKSALGAKRKWHEKFRPSKKT